MPQKDNLNRSIEIFLNPLQIPEIDLNLPVDNSSIEKSILQFACSPNTDTSSENLAKRCQEINEVGPKIVMAPMEERILEKLIWPLRHAKAAYIFANYLGAISHCGMVSEMVAILLFDLSEIKVGSKKLEKKLQKEIFGSPFESLGQERRVQVLYSFDLIDESLKKQFDLIRTTRRSYLHLWSQDHSQLPEDAKKVFKAAGLIVTKVIGQEIKDGKFVLSNALLNYLDKK